MSDLITPEQAGGVLEGETLAIDTDGDAYVLPSGREMNLVALAARDDNGDILNPEIWRELVRRFNAYPALTALAAAQQAQIDRLRELLREADCRIVWEGHGLGGDFAERVESALKGEQK